MRILMVTQFYPPPVGGQERHVRDLARALAGRGHHVEVATIAVDAGVTDAGATGAGATGAGATGAPAGAGEGDDRDVVTVHRLPTTAQRLPGIYADRGRPHALPVPDPALRAGLARLLVDGRFDVVHAHDWAVASLLGPARAAGVPVVLTQHDYSHVCATKRMMRGDELVCPGPSPIACLRCGAGKHGPVVGPGVVLANAIGRRMRRRAVDAFVPVSDAVRRLAPGPAARTTVIPNFVSDDLPGSAPPPPPDAPGAPMLFVGDLLPDKGIGVLFEAYRLMASPPPLHVAGRSHPQTPPGHPPGVSLLGVLEPQAVGAAMRSARLVVVPSLCPDACPSVVLEAMAAARPVVASATGGIAELVEDGASGLLVPAGDARALADALSAVVADPVRAAALGRRGWDRVQRFTASAVAERLEDLYVRLTTGTATASDRRS